MLFRSDYKGKTYLFYHNGALPGGDGFKRSVCVDELKFNPDGSVPLVQPTKEGPAPVATLDPYKRVEAETIAWSSGVKIEPSSAGGQNVPGSLQALYIGNMLQLESPCFVLGECGSVVSHTQQREWIGIELKRHRWWFMCALGLCCVGHSGYSS